MGVRRGHSRAGHVGILRARIVGEAPFYGPITPIATIRANAGPRAVTDPGGGITFTSSATFVTAQNANPGPGSVFVCTAATPAWTSQPTINAGNTVLFPGAVGSKIIDGGGAFRNPFIILAGALVKGGRFQNFGSVAAGAVGGLDIRGGAIEDVECTGIYTTGFSFSTTTGGRATHCRSFNNGRNGYAGQPSGPGEIGGETVEFCEIYGNNTALFHAGGEAGAGKIVFSGNGQFHHNHVHDNIGFGAWWDTDCYAWLIEENVFEDNERAGLFWEANYGGIMRRNYLTNNAKNTVIGADNSAGLYNGHNVRLTDNAAARTDPNGQVKPVEFYRNIVDNTNFTGGDTGMMLAIWDHTDSTSRHVENYDIYENQWWIRNSAQHNIWCRDEDVVAPISTNFQIWDRDVRFFSNEYHVADMAVSYWDWASGTGMGSPQTYAQWQAIHTGETLARIQI